MTDVMPNAARIVFANIERNNCILQCVQSGSKGKTFNIVQIMACLGQQIHMGRRISNDGMRTAPTFDASDMEDPKSRGLIEQPYVRGIQTTDYYFHGMAGREGLIDTARRTAETGYLQRKLTKFLESEYVAQDGTIRDGNMNLLPRFGEDGIDPEKQVKVTFGLSRRRTREEACQSWCGQGALEEEVELLASALARVAARFVMTKNGGRSLIMLPSTRTSKRLCHRGAPWPR